MEGEMKEEQSFAWQCLGSERIGAALLAGPRYGTSDRKSELLKSYSGFTLDLI